MTIRPRHGRRLPAVGLAVFGLIGAPLSAQADAAAGRRAYEHGDYAQAIAEWQAGADKNDPEAELGLGNLYEFGAGDLAQDYHRAAYWYAKAAKRGSVEAEYRLALIYGAGGDNFMADFAEAEKWADLASRSHGIWGGRATDFKKLLDQTATGGERAEGEKRANAWAAARAAVATEAASAAPVQPAPPPPPPAGKSGGCPGWPFPTLPCTEQFPALTGSAPSSGAPATEAPLAALKAALSGIDCATLRSRNSADGAAVITGTVPDADDGGRIERLAARYFAGRNKIAVTVVPPPICRTLVALDGMTPAGEPGGRGLELRLDDGSNRLRQGDPIDLQVRAPAYPVDLRIDYFSLDGRVLHLKPDSGRLPPRLAAGALGRFGDPAHGENWRAGGAPFGTEMIAVVATPALLDLGERARIEEAAAYLGDLEKALARTPAAAREPALIATLLVKTSAR